MLASVDESAALMVIDHERLQRAAWTEFNLARKRFIDPKIKEKFIASAGLV